MGAFISSHRRALFDLAAGVNIVGIPLVSKWFANPDLAALDAPNFSTNSLVLIMLWGAAYAACARTEGFPGTCRGLSAVFFAEKIVYVVAWLRFLFTQGGSGELATVLALANPVSKLFFLTYGAWDGFCAFAIFGPAALCDAREGDGVDRGAGAPGSGGGAAEGKAGTKLA